MCSSVVAISADRLHYGSFGFIVINKIKSNTKLLFCTNFLYKLA